MSFCALSRNSNHVDSKKLKNVNERINNSALSENIIDALSVGDVVECVTKLCNFNGEVLVYNENDNFIVIRDGRKKDSIMHIINLNHIVCVSYFLI